jgi:biotin operon repressor
MSSKVQHVQIPHPIAKSKVKIKDWLVYANIKRYMNKDTRTAFPSIATISEHCQCSENLVRQAIERLSECGYLQVTARKNQTNLYTFPELLEKFEMFTPEFLDDPNVDTNLKAYIIGLQALSFINSENKTQSVCGYSNYEIADKLNISERKVKTYNAELKGKEILTEVSSTAIDEAGFNKSLKIIDLDKVHLAVLYVAGKVVEIEERQDEFDERLQKIEEALLRISRQSQVAYESTTKQQGYKKKYKKAGN